MENLIQTMRLMSQKSIDDPRSHFLLRLILANDSAPAPWAIWRWARNDVRFHDEYPQIVASLPRLLDAPVGDCNDLAVATAVLLRAARLPVQWALGYDEQGKPRHIWTMVKWGDHWLHVDPSPGAEPPGGLAPSRVANATINNWEPFSI